MGTCENLFVIQDTKDEEAKDVEHKTTVMKLIACQQELLKLHQLQWDQMWEKYKTCDEEGKCTLKEIFKRRNNCITKIPYFWINAIISNPNLPFCFTEFELVCLKYVSRIEIDEPTKMTNGLTGTKVSFYFTDNPYIENNVISKQFSWEMQGLSSSTCSATPIIWKKDAESIPLQTETQKPLSSGRCTFFEWLANNGQSTILDVFQILDFYFDPLDCFILADNYCKTCGNEGISTLLDEVIKYQEDINNTIDEESPESASLKEKNSEEIRKLLYERESLIKEIPKFWPTVITSHPDLSRIIRDNERDCLQYLVDIDLQEMECSEDTCIHFYFSENNPYFANSVISKECTTEDGEESVKSTQIEWKENKCLFSESQECGDSSCKDSERNVRNFFDWFNDDSGPDANMHILCSLLQLWKDPVQYYIKAVFDDVIEDYAQDSEIYASVPH